MADIPLITLWEFLPPQAIAVRLTSSPPVRIEQTPFPRTRIWVNEVPWHCTGITTSGIERTAGVIPTIRLTIKLNEYLKARQSFVFVPGTIVIRYQTDALAADGVNWADGNNPYGTTRELNHRVDRWVLTRRLDESEDEISFNASDEQSFWDVRVRPDIGGKCYHKYRGKDCGYTGTNYFDKDGNPVDDAKDDVCGLSIKDCELRFPTGPLPFGGGPIVTPLPIPL